MATTAGTSSSSSPGRKLRLGPTGLTEKEQVHGLERYFTEREKFFTDRELELSTQIASLLAENGNLCKQLDGAKEKLKNVEAREISGIAGLQRDMEKVMGENDELHRAKRSAAKTEASNSEEIRELTEKLARAEQALEEKSDKIAGLELKLKQSEQQLNYKTEALSAVERENVALRRFQAEMREAGDRQLQRSSATLEQKCEELLLETLDARRIAEAARGDRKEMEERVVFTEANVKQLEHEMVNFEKVYADNTAAYQRLEVGLFRVQVDARRKKLLRKCFLPWRTLGKKIGDGKIEERTFEVYGYRLGVVWRRRVLLKLFSSWKLDAFAANLRKKIVAVCKSENKFQSVLTGTRHSREVAAANERVNSANASAAGAGLKLAEAQSRLEQQTANLGEKRRQNAALRLSKGLQTLKTSNDLSAAVSEAENSALERERAERDAAEGTRLASATAQASRDGSKQGQQNALSAVSNLSSKVNSTQLSQQSLLLLRSGFLAWKYCSLVKQVAVNFEKFETYDRKRDSQVKRMSAKISSFCGKRFHHFCFREWKMRWVNRKRQTAFANLNAANMGSTRAGFLRGGFVAWRVWVQSGRRLDAIMAKMARTTNPLASATDRWVVVGDASGAVGEGGGNVDGEGSGRDGSAADGAVFDYRERNQQMSEKVRQLLDEQSQNAALEKELRREEIREKEQRERSRSGSPPKSVEKPQPLIASPNQKQNGGKINRRGSPPGRVLGSSSSRSPNILPLGAEKSHTRDNSFVVAGMTSFPQSQMSPRTINSYATHRSLEAIKLEKRKNLLAKRVSMAFSGAPTVPQLKKRNTTGAPTVPQPRLDPLTNTISIPIPEDEDEQEDENDSLDHDGISISSSNSDETQALLAGDLSPTGSAGNKGAPGQQLLLQNKSAKNVFSTRPRTTGTHQHQLANRYTPGRQLLQRCILNLWRQRGEHAKARSRHSSILKTREEKSRSFALQLGDLRENRLQEVILRQWHKVVTSSKVAKTSEKLHKLKFVSQNVVHRVSIDMEGHVTEKGVRKVFASWQALASGVQKNVHRSNALRHKSAHVTSLRCVEEYFAKRNLHELTDDVFRKWKTETREMRGLKKLQLLGRNMALFLDNLGRNMLAYTAATNGVAAYGGEYVVERWEGGPTVGNAKQAVPAGAAIQSDFSSGSGSEEQDRAHNHFRLLQVARRSVFAARKTSDLLIVHPTSGVDLASCHLRRTSLNMHKLLKEDKAKNFACTGLGRKKDVERITSLSANLIAGHVPAGVLVRSPSASPDRGMKIAVGNKRSLIYQEPATRPTGGSQFLHKAFFQGEVNNGNNSRLDGAGMTTPRRESGGARVDRSADPNAMFNSQLLQAPSAGASNTAEVPPTVVMINSSSAGKQARAGAESLIPPTITNIGAGGAITGPSSSDLGVAVGPLQLSRVPGAYPATLTADEHNAREALRAAEATRATTTTTTTQNDDLLTRYLSAFDSELKQTMHDFHHFFVSDLLEHAFVAKNNRDLCACVFTKWQSAIAVIAEEKNGTGKEDKIRVELLKNKQAVFSLIGKNDTIKMAAVCFGEWKSFTISEKSARTEQFARQCALKVMAKMGVDLFGQQTSHLLSDIVREWALHTKTQSADKKLNQEMERKRTQVEAAWKFAKTRSLLARDDPDVMRQACFMGWRKLSLEATAARAVKDQLDEKKDLSLKMMKNLELTAKHATMALTSSFHMWKHEVQQKATARDHESVMEKLKLELEGVKLVEVGKWRNKADGRLSAKERILDRAVRHFQQEHMMKAWRKFAHDEKYERKCAECKRGWARAFKSFEALTAETQVGIKMQAMDLWKSVVRETQAEKVSDALKQRMQSLGADQAVVRLQVAFAQDRKSIQMLAFKHWSSYCKDLKADKEKNLLAAELHGTKHAAMAEKLKKAFGEKSQTMLLELMFREWGRFVEQTKADAQKKKIEESANTYAAAAMFTVANRDSRSLKTLVFRAWADMTASDLQLRAQNHRLLELKSTLGAIRLWGKFGGVADEGELLKKFVEMWHETAKEEKKRRLLMEAKAKTKEVCYRHAFAKIVFADNLLKLRCLVGWVLARERAKRHAVEWAGRMMAFQLRSTFGAWLSYTSREVEAREQELVVLKKHEAQKAASYRRLQLALANGEKTLQVQVLKMWKEVVLHKILEKTNELKDKIEKKAVSNADRLLKSLHNLMDSTDAKQTRAFVFKAWKDVSKSDRFKTVLSGLKVSLQNVQTRSITGKIDLQTDRGKRKMFYAWRKAAHVTAHESKIHSHKEAHGRDKQKLVDGVDVLFVKHLAGRSLHTLFESWHRYTHARQKVTCMSKIASLTGKNAKQMAVDALRVFLHWKQYVFTHLAVHMKKTDLHHAQKEELIDRHVRKHGKKLVFHSWQRIVTNNKTVRRHMAYLFDQNLRNLLSCVFLNWGKQIHADNVEKFATMELRSRKALVRVGRAFSAAHDGKLVSTVLHKWKHAVEVSKHTELAINRNLDRNSYLSAMNSLLEKHNARILMLENFAKLRSNYAKKRQKVAKLSLVTARNELMNWNWLSEILQRWRLVVAEARFDQVNKIGDAVSKNHKLRKIHIFRNWRMARLHKTFSNVHAEHLLKTKQNLLLQKCFSQWFVLTIPMQQLEEKHGLVCENLERVMAEANFLKAMRPVLQKWQLIAHRAKVLRYYRNCRRELLQRATFASWGGFARQRAARAQFLDEQMMAQRDLRRNGPPAAASGMMWSAIGAGIGGSMLGGNGASGKKRASNGAGGSSRRKLPRDEDNEVETSNGNSENGSSGAGAARSRTNSRPPVSRNPFGPLHPEDIDVSNLTDSDPASETGNSSEELYY
eukprot:g9139.t1